MLMNNAFSHYGCEIDYVLALLTGLQSAVFA